MPEPTQPSRPSGQKVHDCSDCTHVQSEQPARAEPVCEWFSWFGGPVCEECGKAPGAHKGLSWVHPDGPFSLSTPDLHIPWSDYGPGRDLNIPMLTSVMPEGMLAALQTAQNSPQSAVDVVCTECGEDRPDRFDKTGACRHCAPLNPRWRDYHTLPDEWVINKVRGLWRGRMRGSWLHKRTARYALKHLHCSWDGQCVFRSGHRGCCYWGDEE